MQLTMQFTVRREFPEPEGDPQLENAKQSDAIEFSDLKWFLEAHSLKINFSIESNRQRRRSGYDVIGG
jgi:hypothetical protein